MNINDMLKDKEYLKNNKYFDYDKEVFYLEAKYILKHNSSSAFMDKEDLINYFNQYKSYIRIKKINKLI